MTAATDRAGLIRAVHARAREIGLDLDARRALQERAAGKSSCADMSAAELRRVLEEMYPGRTRPDAGASRARDTLPDSPGAAKLRALWISAWHLGVVRDRTDAGLAAWLRRQTGLDAAAWAAPAAVAAAVEALKSWLTREAGVCWEPYAAYPKPIANPRARVLEAQWRRLHSLGAVRAHSLAALAAYACRHAGIARVDSHTALTAAQADALIREFGGRLRKALGRSDA